MLGAYPSAFFLTLTIPITLLVVAALFTALGVGKTINNLTAAAVLVLRVFTGSACWWFLISSGIGFMRTLMNPGRMKRLNRITGTAILGFGIYKIIRFLVS